MITSEAELTEVKALQAMIRERLQGDTEKPIAQHYRELVDLFTSEDAPF